MPRWNLIPYMAVVGPREAETRSIALRDRIEGELGTKPVSEVLSMLAEEVNQRRIRFAVQKETAEPEQPKVAETASHEY